MRAKQLIVDMLDGEIHETDLFSPCVRFKGGGSSTTTSISSSTPDYAFNARMAAVAEKEQAIADEYFSFYKSYYQPMEQEQIAANRALIPRQTALEQEKIGLESAQTKAAAGLLPAQTEVAEQQLATTKGILRSAQEETELAKPVMSEYYKQSLAGVNPNEKVQQARADVAASFSGQDAAARRAAGRMGIDPNSSRFMEGMAGRGIAQAKATAGAMTGAKTAAENENYARLSGAVDTYKKNLGLGG